MGEICPSFYRGSSFSPLKSKQIMNGAGGKFSRMGVGKIFYIYMYDTKNWKVKAIDSLNTNSFGLVD